MGSADVRSEIRYWEFILDGNSNGGRENPRSGRKLRALFVTFLPAFFTCPAAGP